MEAWGLTPEDYEGDAAEVWPENWRSVMLFIDIKSQWRVAGMGGCVGLDYNVLFKKLDRMELTRDEYDQIEDDVRVMEYEAMSVMSQ
jgi:hypothetical protein